MVYIIHCIKCSKLDISKTGHILDIDFNEHLADIKYHRDKPVANHFNQAGHSIHKVHFRLLFMDKARDMKDMESYLIKKTWQKETRGKN